MKIVTHQSETALVTRRVNGIGFGQWCLSLAIKILQSSHVVCKAGKSSRVRVAYMSDWNCLVGRKIISSNVSQASFAYHPKILQLLIV